MKIRQGDAFRILVDVFAMALLVVALTYIGPAKAYDIGFSLSPDKVEKAKLDGATVEDLIYVFIPSVVNVEIRLSWTPNVDLEDPATDGYIVYEGPDITVPNKLDPTIPHDATKFQVFPTLPAPYNTEKRVWVNYVEKQFGTDEMCFRLKAYNFVGTSGYSKAICTNKSAISDVVFYMDDPQMSGAPLHRESIAPWDMMGENPDSIAHPFDASKLEPGQHTITAIVNYTEGPASNKQEATFTVRKKSPALPTNLRVIQVPIHESIP